MRTITQAGAAALGVAACVLIGTSIAPAQAPQDDVREVVRELRGIRTAVERMSTFAPRVQLALARLQLQEQRVDTLVRRVDTIRMRLNEAQRGQTQMQQQLTNAETRLRTEASEAEREALERQVLPHLKASLTTLTEEVQRLIAEEAAAAQDLASEQSRWIDINQRLEALERSLSPE